MFRHQVRFVRSEAGALFGIGALTAATGIAVLFGHVAAFVAGDAGAALGAQRGVLGDRDEGQLLLRVGVGGPQLRALA